MKTLNENIFQISVRPNTEYSAEYSVIFGRNYSAEYSANSTETPNMQKTSIFDHFHVIFSQKNLTFYVYFSLHKGHEFFCQAICLEFQLNHILCILKFNLYEMGKSLEEFWAKYGHF